MGMDVAKAGSPGAQSSSKDVTAEATSLATALSSELRRLSQVGSELASQRAPSQPGWLGGKPASSQAESLNKKQAAVATLVANATRLNSANQSVLALAEKLGQLPPGAEGASRKELQQQLSQALGERTKAQQVANSVRARLERDAGLSAPAANTAQPTSTKPKLSETQQPQSGWLNSGTKIG